MRERKKNLFKTKTMDLFFTGNDHLYLLVCCPFYPHYPVCKHQCGYTCRVALYGVYHY